MNKIITITISIITIIVISLFIFMPKVTFSDNENRYLQTIPILSIENITTTKFMKDIESYIEDHFPFRTFFISIKKNIELKLLKDENNKVFILKDDYLIEKYESLKDETIKNISNVLNTFNNKNKDVNITTMIIPTSYTINKNRLPKFVDKNLQLKDIQKLYNNLETKKLDITDLLYKRNKEQDLYFRLDHHWNINGAFIAYQTYLKYNNIEPIEASAFKQVLLTTNFNGTIFSKSGEYNFKPDKITNLYNEINTEVNYIYSNRIADTMFEKKYLDKKDKYSYFLDNNHPLITIKNKDINNQEELLVIKDSYANILVPLLANHYKKIHVIDPRFYKDEITKYITDNNLKNVLILYNANTIGKDTGVVSIR